MHDRARECRCRRAGGRVLVGRRAGHHHADVEGAVVVNRLAAVDIRSRMPRAVLRRHGLGPGPAVEADLCGGLQVGDRYGHIGHARRPERDLVVFKADFVRIEAKGRSERFGIGRQRQRFGKLRQVEFAERRSIAAFHRTADRSDIFLQHEDTRGAIAFGHLRQRHRRSDRRVAGERQFMLRRKNADTGAVAGILRWQHENGFRQVELARDRLHGRFVEPVCVHHDGKLVPRQGLVGEHVVEEIFPSSHRQTPPLSPKMSEI